MDSLTALSSGVPLADNECLMLNVLITSSINLFLNSFPRSVWKILMAESG